ncbi:MAG: class GN sortase [Colwellia sp.]
MKNVNTIISAKSKVALIIASVAFCLIVNSAWLPVKAWLAQQLIFHNWQQNQSTNIPSPPWPWADTHAIAKMSIPRLKKSLVLLQGVDPTTLAFSAGVMHQYANLTKQAPFIVAGHRDTHFSFLQEIMMKDIISMTDKNGNNQLYQVEKMEIIDSQESPLSINEHDPSLVLITCYPFKALESGGSLRYVITAKLLET